MADKTSTRFAIAPNHPHDSTHTASADPSRDFDFLFGRWKIENERLLERLQGCRDWETFDAEHEARPILGGRGNMDELTAVRWRPGFVGMSLRLFDPATKKWSIYWADNVTGVLQPPVVGGFSGGVGIFEGRDVFAGKPILVRFVWSEITRRSAKWEQLFSPDEGQTWEKNWVMHFTRIEG